MRLLSNAIKPTLLKSVVFICLSGFSGFPGFRGFEGF